MGCVSSREARLDRRRSQLLPYGRSLSMPVVHGSRRNGDSLHVVSLTSSTLGFLELDHNQESSDEEKMKVANDRNHKPPKSIAAGACDVRPPEPESETINAWELMEGLEENESAFTVERSLSFDAIRGSTAPPPANIKSSATSAAGSPKPFWMQNATLESVQVDPEVISNFRKAMTELSPQHPTLRRRSPVKYRPDEIPKFPGIVKARVAAFQEKIDARRASLKISPLEKSPPGGKGKLVLYFTSLRGVRKTYEDCWNARVILQGYGVRIDERDVSMHGGFRDELNEILRYEYGATTGSMLPKIFANGRCLGGAEEVIQMHESGKLGEALKECEMVETMKGSSGIVCEACDNFRFFPCEICFGSCKVFVEEEEDQIGGFRRCINCNENGLIRCPLCC